MNAKFSCGYVETIKRVCGMHDRLGCLAAVGARVQLFSNDACALIAKASHGIPRTINILCDTALVYGYSTSAERITADVVEAVIKNKQNFGILPMTKSRV